MEKLKPYAFLILAGILYTLGFPNVLEIYIPMMPIIGTAIITYYIFKTESTKQQIVYYLFYNSVINLISFYWITKTLQDFGNLPFIIAATMNALFALILNPQYFILILVLKLLKDNHPKIKETYFKHGMFSLILAITFTILEYFVPQQFPVMLGQPWIIYSEYLGAAQFLGLPVFSFFSYLLAYELIRIIKVKRASLFNLSAILLFIFINPFLVNESETTEKTEYNVRLVQANISNFLKVDSEKGGYASVSEVLERYKELSVEPFEIQDKTLDLIVWPETAYPYPIRTNKINIMNSTIPKVFSKIVYETNSSMLIGGYDHFKDNDDGSYFKTEYNAALLINPLGQLVESYHKHVLIPFGETLPLGSLNKWASKKLPEMAFFEEGKKYSLFETESDIKFISSICYEILRPEFVRDYLNNATKRPHMMINLTNDSWYGNTVEPEQHLFLARWRAIEFNLPILRSTNTGISTYINNKGSEVKRLEYGITGNLDLSLQLPQIVSEKDSTFYQKFGFWGILPFWLLFFIFHVFLLKLKNEKTN
jgi:apolipoprotein N-acyltransferase